MDIRKEREAFEKHTSKFFTDSKEAFKTNGNQYLYDEVIWMWDCWIERAKAQAVPEGFVLVSKTPSLKVLGRLFAEHDLDEDRATYIYKDIIDAQEPAND